MSKKIEWIENAILGGNATYPSEKKGNSVSFKAVITAKEVNGNERLVAGDVVNVLWQFPSDCYEVSKTPGIVTYVGGHEMRVI